MLRIFLNGFHPPLSDGRFRNEANPRLVCLPSEDRRKEAESNCSPVRGAPVFKTGGPPLSRHLPFKEFNFLLVKYLRSEPDEDSGLFACPTLKGGWMPWSGWSESNTHRLLPKQAVYR